MGGSAVGRHVLQRTDLFDGSTPDLLRSLLTDKVAQQGYDLPYQGVGHLSAQKGAWGVTPAAEGGEGRGGKETEADGATHKRLEKWL